MPDLTTSAELSVRVRVMQIVLGSLVMGPLFFAAIVLVVRQGGNFQPPETPIMSYVVIGFSLVLFITHLIVPNLVVASGRKSVGAGTWKSTPALTIARDLSDQDRMLSGLFQTQMIVSAAMLEGAIFALLIAYQLEGELVCVVIAGVLLIRMVSLFPTRSKVERWIEAQRDVMQLNRSGA